MTKAFLFGKFHPFHKGHEAMIRFALEHCDFLSVLVCCSDRETIPCSVRTGWIQATFAEEKRLEVVPFNYSEDDFPNTSTSSESVSAIWSEIFKRLFPDYDLVVTSEPYGDFVARFMGIRHLPFDPEKKVVPISASQIKKDIWANWHYLPDSVKPYFVKKVAVLGTESTGKSTLVQQLAAHFNGTAVSEAARNLISDSNNITIDDLYAVAHAHTQRIAQACSGAFPLVIIDTDIHITQSYAHHFFHTALDIPEDMMAIQHAGLYLYLDKDVPFIQDGTRLHEAARNSLDTSHQLILHRHNVEYVVIKGNWQERFLTAVRAVESYLHNAV